MSANAYWIEAVSAALEEAGIEATSEQIAEVGQLLARDLQASQQQVAALREALKRLTAMYVANPGTPSQFILTITPRTGSSGAAKAWEQALAALTPTPEDAR